MPININKINNVSAVTKSAISRKSAQTLPNNPSEQGYSAEEIKRRFYQPILDAANSAIAEIDRVVNEMNISFGQVSDELDNFIDTTKITEAYKLELNNESWVKNEETGMYEVVISQEEHKIADYKEIGVDMFLLDGNGNYTHVNQFEVQLDCSVRCFHETNGAGYVSIYVKREGFIVGSTIVDADHVIGLAKVGRTNNYEDLDNKPDTGLMTQNEIMISKMISGTQPVAKAGEAEKATSANYAQTSGSSTHANTADAAVKAEADQYGVNISSSYAKQNGNYAGLRAGNANNADKAKADEDGLNIKTNYAKQNGTYKNMSVGSATNATNATNAQTANKATADGNGANIASTYAKMSGTYSNMSVGKATNADKATQADKATSATTADRATKDGNGNVIANTYTTGMIIERQTITIQVRVTEYQEPSLAQTYDLFRDAPTPFAIDVITARNIGSNTRFIIAGSFVRQIIVGSHRYDYNHLLLNLPNGYVYPKQVRLISNGYQNGVVPCYADMTGQTNVSGTVFQKYNMFDDGYDFKDDAYIAVEFIN